MKIFANKNQTYFGTRKHRVKLMNVKRIATLLTFAVCFAGACRAMTVPPPRATFPDASGDVRGIAFSPDGKRLAISTGQLIKIWEWESGKGTGREIASIQGGIGAAFSTDGTLLAFPGQDENYSDGLLIWDIAANKKKLFIADDNVQSPAFSPDGKNIAAAVGSRVKIWKLAAGEELAILKDGHKCSITAIVYASTGKALISADGKGTILYWDLSVPAPVKKGEYKPSTEEAVVNSLTSSPDGKWIAASTGTGEILVLDATTLTVDGTIKGHKDGLRVKSVAFSPDNKTLASACSGIEDLEIKLWDASSRLPILGFVGHQDGVNCVAFSPDGKWLATGSDDKSAKVWELAALYAMVAPKPEKKKEKPKPQE